MLKRVGVAGLICSILSGSVLACLWDRDTPQAEALTMPEVVAALTGRFERNPPLYYEMRLARVQQHLQDHPEDLAAYDDAGVACDRLGRGDEAIEWMQRKREQIPEAGSERETHLYRYHANLGTFIIHRWLRQGADRSNMDDVHASREQIAKCIEINPDAHFGREAYQLRAIDWILTPPNVPTEYHPNLLGWRFSDIYGTHTEPSEADEAVRALAGLVMLGNAWESVDIFNALNVALQRDSVGYERGREGGRNSLAYFAWLRCNELVDAGKRSLYPGSPTGNALKSVLHKPDFVSPELLLDSAFVELREEADAWHRERLEYMEVQLKAGRHPDTDPGFWDGYVDTPAPPLPLTSVPDAFTANQAAMARNALIIIVLLVGSLFGSIVFLVVRRLRRRPKTSEA